MLAPSPGRRSLQKALGAVSPLAFAEAVERYVTALPAEEVRALALRSIKRFDAAERVQFAMFLGYEARSGGQEEPLVGAGMRVQELQALINACDDFLPNRFAAFLRENRRAIPALGEDALKRILATLPEAQFDESSTPAETPRRRIPAPVAALVALTLLVAIAPLIAQYAHQRGMIAGAPDVLFAPPAQPVRVAAVPAKAQPVHAAPHRQVRHAPAHHAAPRANTSHAQAFAPVRHVTLRRPSPHMHRTRIAAAWKFDPSQNPYFTRKWHRGGVAYAAPRARAAGTPQAEDAFSGRARLIVASYLNAVISGDTGRALQHLGMAPTADPKAISESPIVSRDARAEIVGVKRDENGQVRVQVDINGRRGEYFEVFSVQPDGRAARIADRYFIPVNRTAEEVSARLLAKTTH